MESIETMEKTAKRFKTGMRLKEYLASTGNIKAVQPEARASLNFPVQTGAIKELPALDQLQKMVTRAQIEEAPTMILTSLPPHLKEAYAAPVQPATKKPASPRIYEHRAELGVSSLSLIFETIILCQKYQGALPDCIYVSNQTQADLITEAPIYTGVDWTGEFYFSRGRKEIEAIPVFPENMLPNILKFALDGRIPEHYAIALIEQ